MKKILFILVVFSAACKEAYDPPVISTNQAYLVVEGFINSGTDSTVFTLSHTFKLSDTARATPELKAHVSVEGNDNSVHPLGEMGNGNYGAALSLNAALQYRLHILTSAGKEYRSDFVPLRTSPPIDSIGWKLTDQGLQIYTNTHDPQNASTYYRWSYQETWEFNAIYHSDYEYLPVQDSIIPRAVDSFYTCWKGDLSNTILLGSTAKLAQDLIYQAPMLTIPSNSWEISVEYSILVKQYVLTPDAYNFWLNLQRNTEQIGSIFSPQPSETKGNIHAVADSSEEVIGYVSAGTLSQKRVFIRHDDIPGWAEESYQNNCTLISIPDNKDSLKFYLNGPNAFIPVAVSPGMAMPPRYDVSYSYCVDCTQVGSNVKPSFWP